MGFQIGSYVYLDDDISYINMILNSVQDYHKAINLTFGRKVSMLKRTNINIKIGGTNQSHFDFKRYCIFSDDECILLPSVHQSISLKYNK